MDRQVSELILTHNRIAYLKTDIRFMVIEAGGSLKLLQYFGFKNPEIRSLRAEVPGNGAFFAFKATDPFSHTNLRDIIPNIENYNGEFLNILHGVVPTIEFSGLFIGQKQSEHRCKVNLRSIAETDKAGRIVGLIHLIEDISDIHEALTEKATLDHRIDMLQNQLDMVAHELGTPLTLVSGYLEILKDIAEHSMSSEQQQCMELIEGNVDNLHIVVKSLFDLVFAEADGLRLALQPIDITKLVQNSIKEFGNQLATKSQKVALKTSSACPNALCDNTRVIQVINNLLSNASKFSPVGSTIEIEITSDLEDKMIQISITDNGLGIPQDEQKIIFDRFYRTKFGTRAEVQGAGLGLYLSRMIVQMHRGQIWCQNSSKKGSTFCFTLPCTDLPIPNHANGSGVSTMNGSYHMAAKQP